MMFEKMKVRLPFSREREVEVCSVCGDSFDNGVSARLHEKRAARIPLKPDVKVGDVVEITTAYGHYSRQSVREPWRVTNLFYSGAWTFLLPRGRKTPREPEPHTLCIQLAQNFHHQAYDPDAKDKSHHFFATTYLEFMILRRGDIKELRSIGVLKPLSWWDRLRGRK